MKSKSDKKCYSKKYGSIVIKNNLFKFYMEYGGGSYVNGNKDRGRGSRNI